ncbi:MAG: fibronectin type III domain-containing protein [Actinobacteria bacterium]|jgi:hypothetical protein|nr:fibronectin type III domain-containing protein [Actinomycetota bacterium]
MTLKRIEKIMINRSTKFIAIIATTSALLLSACGGAATESQLRNGVVSAVAPDTPAQIFVKIDTQNTTPWCCTATPKHIAKLRWSAPVNDGGSPIIGYEIQVKWNAVEGAKAGASQIFKNWTSCATLDKSNPGMFPGCTTALTSNDNSAVIDSPIWQKSSDALSQRTVQALDYRIAAINAVGKSGFSPATQTTCKYGGPCEVGDLGPGGGVVYEIAKYGVSSTGTITSDTSQVSPGFVASEVSGADWQLNTTVHNWAAMARAGATQCPGTSCYTPTPPKPCFDYTKQSVDIQTCQSKESWHLPFVSPLNNGNEWKFLCNKYSELNDTWGRLRGSDALMYWSGSLPLKRAGLSFNLTVGNIISLVSGAGAASVLLDMTNSALENSMASTYGTGSAMRFPCSPNTKLVNNNYDSNGGMYYPTSPSLGANSGKLYTDNSVLSRIDAKANLSIPIRHFSPSKPPLAPQVAPVLTAAAGDGGVRLSWTPGQPSASLANALKSAQVLPPVDYVIKYRAAGTTTWSTLTDEKSVNVSAVIGNGVLTKGTKYDFAVAEVNSLGTSTFSSAASAVPGPYFQDAISVSTTTGSYPSVTLAHAGGSGTGAVAFTTPDSAKGCSINGTTLTVTNIGTCRVTVSKASDADYISATSETRVITIEKAKQAPISLTSLTKPFDEPLTLTSGGGSGDGAVSYEVMDTDRSTCLLAADVLKANFARPGGGICRVRVVKATSANYLEGASEFTQVLFTQGAQAPLVLDKPANATFPINSVPLVARGGLGEGEVTFNVRNGTAKDCKVWFRTTVAADGSYGSKVSPSGFGATAIGTGTCLITATKAGDRNYRSITSNEVTATFNKAEQSALTMGGAAIGSRAGTALIANGGSGTGDVTFKVETSTTPTTSTLTLAKNCTVTGAQLTSDNRGSCWVSAVKAGDENYLPSAPSPKAEFLLQTSSQPALSLAISPKTGPAAQSTSVRLTVTGGAGTGAIVYGATGGTARGCVVTSTAIYATSAGTCQVTATKMNDQSYNEAAASETFTFTLVKQSALNVTSVHGEGLSLAKGLKLTTSGGSGSGAVTYSLVQEGSAKCSLSSGVLTAKSMGTCVVNASRDGDATFEATTSSNTTISFDIRVGDTGPGGGTIAYIADTMQPWGRYLEIAPSTWNGTSDPALTWADAVTAASKYRGGSKSDWRLPNDAELAIFRNLDIAISKRTIYADSTRTTYAEYMASTFAPGVTRFARPMRAYG